MANLTKVGVAIAVISTAAYLQGCSSGDSFVQELTPGGVDSGPSGAFLDGTLAKGLLSFADCTVEDVAGNVLFTSVGAADACSDANGVYRIQLEFNPTSPIINTVTTRTTTRMTCDDPAGCAGGVAFGGAVESLGDNFTLRAVVPSVDPNATSLNVSVNPWTEIATARVISEAGSVAAVTEAATQTAYREVASVLNNILSLEGTDDEFDGNFFDIPLPDLSNPSTDSVSNAEDQRRAALLSIASGSLLKLTSDSVTPAAVITQLTDSFSSDGEFNVNDTATNIEAGDAINLASIVTNVATTVSTLATELASNTDGTAALETLLGVSDLETGLAEIESDAEELAEEKTEVADADQDTTKPQPVIDASTTAFTKAKTTAANLVTLLDAGNFGLNDDEGANTVFEDVSNVIEGTSADYDVGLEVMAELMEGASDMILSNAENDTGAFNSCTITSESISCTAMQLAATLDDPWADLNNASGGTVVLNISTNTVTATDVSVDGMTLALVMVGTSETTNPTYTVTSATVDLPDDTGTDDITFGSEATVSEVSTSGSESFTIDAKDITLNLADFTLVADLAATRDLTLRDTLLTNFRLTGYLMIASDTTLTGVADASKGERVKFTLAFKGNRTGLTNPTDNSASLPMPADETEDNFLVATDIEFVFSYPTEVNVRSVQSDGSIAMADTATASTFTMTLAGTRNAVKSGDVTTLILQVVGAGGLNAALSGDLTVETTSSGSVDTQTSTYTLGDTDTVVTLILADTGSARTLSGSLATTAGVNAGSINAAGTMTVNDPEDSTAAGVAVSLPAALLIDDGT